jgi:hypothetical protein
MKNGEESSLMTQAKEDAHEIKAEALRVVGTAEEPDLIGYYMLALAIVHAGAEIADGLRELSKTLEVVLPLRGADVEE